MIENLYNASQEMVILLVDEEHASSIEAELVTLSSLPNF